MKVYTKQQRRCRRNSNKTARKIRPETNKYLPQKKIKKVGLIKKIVNKAKSAIRSRLSNKNYEV